MTLRDLEKEIEKLKQRNAHVEADKAWETSTTRKFLIALFTYLAIALYLWFIEIPQAPLHAIVPTVGFLLSVTTFATFKKIWLKQIYRK
ncbi:MAG: hypothetical protein KKA90_01640 [Nanoarchaeota archaeon]|nr:hypothetical protein [Nanoarchaeota archaeon]